MKTVPSNYKSKTAIAIAMTAVLGVSAQAADNDIKVTWKDSLRLETADGNNKLRIGGRIHWDNAFSSDDDYMSDGDTFRRARLYVSGQIQERYDFKMQYDFAGGDADFKDVYFGIKGFLRWATFGSGNLRNLSALRKSPAATTSQASSAQTSIDCHQAAAQV